MPVPLLGQMQLPEFSTRETALLWENASALPQIPETYRIRLSSCGEWVIRMLETKRHPASKVVEAAQREYSRLAEMGVNVMAFCGIPSVSEKRVFTVTPWVEGLSECSLADFEELVQPAIIDYERFAKNEPGALSVGELDWNKQFSFHPELEVPILHDVDPYIMGLTASLHY